MDNTFFSDNLYHLAIIKQTNLNHPTTAKARAGLCNPTITSRKNTTNTQNKAFIVKQESHNDGNHD